MWKELRCAHGLSGDGDKIAFVKLVCKPCPICCRFGEFWCILFSDFVEELMCKSYGKIWTKGEGLSFERANKLFSKEESGSLR